MPTSSLEQKHVVAPLQTAESLCLLDRCRHLGHRHQRAFLFV